MNETESQLCQLLRTALDKEFPDLTAATDLVDDLALESIQVMDFIAEVEDHFDILIGRRSWLEPGGFSQRRIGLADPYIKEMKA